MSIREQKKRPDSAGKGRLKPMKTPSGSLNVLMNIRKSLGKGGENQKKMATQEGCGVKMVSHGFY